MHHLFFKVNALTRFAQTAYVLFALWLITIFSYNAYSNDDSHIINKFTILNVIDLESGNNNIIKIAVGGKEVHLNRGISVTSAICINESSSIKIADHISIIRIKNYSQNKMIFQGWISKRHSPATSAGRMIFTLHGCSNK